MRNYSGAISKCTVPAVGTEVGQYQIYPNYDEIKKYTGVMKPWNLEVFRDRLKENNLSDQSTDFFMASGALSAICYKADIEMAMRTPGLVVSTCSTCRISRDRELLWLAFLMRLWTAKGL